jgi:uroporphyrin-III C-methyltransferase
VHLVGAGPGDPGLITARGLDRLRRAEVVVHDRLIGPELLGEAPADALLIDAGKGPGHAPYAQREINALMIEHARRGRTVVRLKGGDPFVFGRGSEEAAACRDADVMVEVVPGVSSAIAAPAAAGIPVTVRGLAQSFTVVTGHVAEDADGGSAPSAPFAAAQGMLSALSASSANTIVVLMGRASLPALAAQLIAAGRDPATPAACIQSATTPEQRVTRATLATIAEAVDRDGLVAPVVTVIGAVAALDVGGEAGTRGSGEALVAAIGASEPTRLSLPHFPTYPLPRLPSSPPSRLPVYSCASIPVSDSSAATCRATPSSAAVARPAIHR